MLGSSEAIGLGVGSLSNGAVALGAAGNPGIGLLAIDGGRRRGGRLAKDPLGWQQGDDRQLDGWTHDRRWAGVTI
jgi:hypothetical protein